MNSQFVVGIDVGGQTTKLGVVDARGTVLAQTVIRTDTYTDVEPYIAELAEALNKIIKAIIIEPKYNILADEFDQNGYMPFSRDNIIGVIDTSGKELVR